AATLKATKLSHISILIKFFCCFAFRGINLPALLRSYSCGARKNFRLGATNFSDRGAFSCRLHLPPAAATLKATKPS
ncbi:MAG: hypothetical protein ACOYJS_06740, partial [Acutalibacteraceae bacterium]